MKLERSIEQYRNGKPEVIVKGSEAQVLFALQDARKDILKLYAEVERLSSADMYRSALERIRDAAYKGILTPGLCAEIVCDALGPSLPSEEADP